MRQLGMRRAGDLAICLVLLVFAAPLMTLLILALKVDSPGPVLVRQLRQKNNGDHFLALKFRTEWLEPPRNGPPIGLHIARTRVGRLLIVTRMSNLPRLINVLRGEMSLLSREAWADFFD